MKEDSKKYEVEDCRMHEKQFPEVNDLVMCKITMPFTDGAYVELLEYNNRQGMILNSEMSRKRVKHVKQIMKEGREEVLRAIRVDTQQGYIDLSKKNVKVGEIKEFQEQYSRRKHVHNIMKSLAIKINQPKLEDLYLKFGWNLYKEYGHAYDAFKEMLE